MILITQAGKTIKAYALEVRGETIRCTLAEDRRRKEICGIYSDRKRAAEVFLEMRKAAWNEKKSEYTMPQE